MAGVPFSFRSRTIQQAMSQQNTTHLNWRDEITMTPIKNQGETETCWACASVACVEAWHTKATNEVIELSVQQLMDTHKMHRCGRGNPPCAFQHMLTYGGLSTEADYPFTRNYGTPEYNRKVVGITGYGRIPESDEDALLWAVMHGPVVASLEADEDFQNNTTGVHWKPSRESNLNHNVLVIGYGISENKHYWLIQNSAGEQWGREGCAWVPRNVGYPYCNLAKYAYYPTMDGVYPPFVTPSPPPAVYHVPCRCNTCI